ncbi:hypothetical protein [Streptococcus sp. DD13]|uniref:hypothetical protein n=1 Tax=Streptococcus sp. DD13 TaxID=1777881 RepID=UPI000791305D|nr:hypothetical protein [Streptococcus sp. DD13]KXT78805.1 hypothetical protein STRDD13_00402 [Streptococcus sp. DD13]
MDLTILSILIALLIMGSQFLAGYFRLRNVGLILPVLSVVMVFSYFVTNKIPLTISNLLAGFVVILLILMLLIYEYWCGMEMRKRREQDRSK